MSGNKIFIDSNVFLYSLSDDSSKKSLALSYLKKSYITSIQVVNENINVCLKKLKLSKEISFQHGQNILQSCDVKLITKSSIELACKISLEYGYSYWDSLIIAVALENDCNYLYSEDLQDGQIISNQLTIQNPFK